MPANRTQLQSSLHKPYDRVLFAKEVLSPVFGSGFSLHASLVPAAIQPNKSEQAVLDTVSIYGKIKLEDHTEITCYEIVLQPKVRIEQSKVAIQRYIRKLLTSGQVALVNFVTPQNKNVWRLTLVAKDSEVTEEGVKEKTTHTKRYTYLLGPNETCKTAAERFEILSTEKEITFQALINAFSVEKLSKAFFNEYTLHYEDFVEHLNKPGFKKSIFKGDEKAIRDFSKKLLGRIVFLYFVQKKGWLGASNIEYKDGMPDFIKQLFKQSSGNEAFYSTRLTNLFFETLNRERKNDDFVMPDGKKVKVPFLNGGLFDKEEHDEHILTFKAHLFHNPGFEDNIPTAKIRTNCRGFLDFLDAFNFTVHEDSPDEQIVAVDPEMLGHIFENLLEDNKDKGAFYTPKEIVHYMCQESLTEYLTTHLSKEYTVYRPLGNDQLEVFGNETRVGQLKLIEELGDKALNRDEVSYIVKYKDISKLTKAQLKRIDQLLNEVKICDPAIGSGAFPMGLLQEIFGIKEVIAYETKAEWRPAEVKENIIQKSIYGVDIEKGAVDIARLRFWLSLVVDEEKPRPLPNLDYKIVVGDSLISKVKIDGHEEIVEIDWSPDINKDGMFGQSNREKNIELLKSITIEQEHYFHTNPEKKKSLALKIRNLKIDILHNQLELMIKTRGIDTKPNGTSKKIQEQTERYTETKNWKKTDLKLQSMAKDQDKPFEHFDWKLDFPEVLNPNIVINNEKRGFDIIIANPPYVGQKGHKELFQEIKDTQLGKDFHQRRMDLFYFFFHLSIINLKYEGILTFITTNYFLTATYSDKLRKHLFNDTTILSFVNFNELKIFSSALGQHNLITILKKGKFPNFNAKTCVTQKIGLANESIIASIINGKDKDTTYYNQSQHSLFEETSLYIRIGNSNNDSVEKTDYSSIFDKMKSDTDTLKKYFNIEQGIVSGADKVTDLIISEYPSLNLIKGEGIFILTKKEVDNLNLSQEDLTLIKPVYKNSDLKKWYFRPKNELFLIYLKDEGKPIKLGNSLIKHFNKFKDILVDKKENCFKNQWLKKIVEPWLLRGNFFVLFYPRNKQSFEKIKIVNSRRSYTNAFALEDQKYFEQSDIVFSTLKPEYENKFDLRYFLGILNSKLLFIWFYHKGKRKGEQLEIFQKPLSEVPIKLGNKATQEKIINLVDKIISTKKYNTNENIVKFEKQIDVIIYHLYNLTYDESIIIDPDLSKEDFLKIKI